MRIKSGTVFIVVGLLLIAAAGALTAYNLYDEYEAGRQAQQALALFADLPVQDESRAGAEPDPVPAAPQTDAAQQNALPMNTQQPAQENTPEQAAAQEEPDGEVPVWQSPALHEPAREALQAEPEHVTDGQPQETREAAPQPVGETAPLVLPQTTALPEFSFPTTPADEEEIPDYVLNPRMKMPVKEKDGQAYIGVLEIPKLKLTLPVISEWNYARLKKAPCRYAGSAYTDDLVIAAHNYRTHFGNLKKLQPGDEVFFTDAAGNRFEYEVVLTETLMPRDVQEMKSGEFALSLFTCTVGGSYRVTVRCDRMK